MIGRSHEGQRSGCRAELGCGDPQKGCICGFQHQPIGAFWICLLLVLRHLGLRYMHEVAGGNLAPPHIAYPSGVRFYCIFQRFLYIHIRLLKSLICPLAEKASLVALYQKEGSTLQCHSRNGHNVLMGAEG